MARYDLRDAPDGKTEVVFKHDDRKKPVTVVCRCDRADEAGRIRFLLDKQELYEEARRGFPGKVARLLNDEKWWDSTTVRKVADLVRKTGVDVKDKGGYQAGFFSSTIRDEREPGDVVDPNDDTAFLEELEDQQRQLH